MHFSGWGWLSLPMPFSSRRQRGYLLQLVNWRPHSCNYFYRYCCYLKNLNRTRLWCCWSSDTFDNRSSGLNVFLIGTENIAWGVQKLLFAVLKKFRTWASKSYLERTNLRNLTKPYYFDSILGVKQERKHKSKKVNLEFYKLFCLATPLATFSGTLLTKSRT